MKTTMKALLLTAAIVTLSAGVARADDAYNYNDGSWYNWNKNVYLSVGGGWNLQEDQKFRTGSGKGSVDYDDGGWVGEAAIGHAYRLFNLDWRTELEGSYRYNEASDSGSFHSWNAMVNQYYDFHNSSRFTPYVGVGAGVAFEKAENLTSRIPGVNIDGTSTDFAYQGIAGVDYQTTQHSTWGLRYDYFATTVGKFETTSGAVGGARAPYNNNAILLTYRYTFGSAPKAMAEPATYTPPPMQQTQTTTKTWTAPTEQEIEDSPYKIFFANDSYKLTANALQVIKDAASAAGTQHAVVLHLTSNTDTTGSKALNDHLSEQRAKAVRRDLIKIGVSPDMINVVSNAERDLPVPTGNHVQEPRNRVVTIVLQ